ncbi:hypothetical protein PISMIDRAFT_685260 [Pisolithus microcarpus 441]|uniref:Uncharacterized protein n=1 Tax=Pisolithus microcarpus 441 TaxID=765257 RepID=A0A0C9Z508_9AGAM|nr:hypothetical protein PISMIDRAFT_685260 [Pisolithus microcarpus 441]
MTNDMITVAVPAMPRGGKKRRGLSYFECQSSLSVCSTCEDKLIFSYCRTGTAAW